MSRFDGKSILITGTSRGIGKALVDFFASEGAHVFAVSRGESEYSTDEVTRIQCDINDYERIGHTTDALGANIDIVINNAGVICYEDLLYVKREQMEQVFLTNVMSTFLLSQMFAKKMIVKKQKGNIINTLSFAVSIPSAGSGIYAASKAAMASLTRTMAAEWAPYGIRVNGYSPGVVETDMTMSAIIKNKENLIDAIALHEIASTEQMTKIVAFLASDDSAYMTGVNLDASGGKFIVQNAGMVWGKEV